MALKFTGVNRLLTKLSNVAKETNRNTRQALRKGGLTVQKAARENAPVDHGDLEDAIEIEESLTGLNRRMEVAVYVNPDKEAYGEAKVGDYAFYLHDNFEWELGPKSQAKSDANGGKVGPLYLDRALEEHVDEIEQDLQEALSEAFR